MNLPKAPTLKVWLLLSISTIIILFSYFRVLHNYELLTYDLRLRLRPHLQESEDILIIEIEDSTLKNLGKWPLPRDFHASLINVLNEAKAKAIVFDILFSEATQNDEIFSKAISAAGNVYLPQAFYIQERLKKDYLPAKSNLILTEVSTSLRHSADRQGHINVFVDADGKTRKIPLFVTYKDKLIPHLTLRVTCDWLGLNLKNVEFKNTKVVVDNKLSLPVSFNTSFMVNYPDKWKKSFKHLSYFEILRAKSQISKGVKPSLDLSLIKDKVCFIGLTATGTHDLRPTPLENVYPMLGLQASVFNSLISRRFINDAGPFLNTIINFVIFFLSLIICLRQTVLRALLGSTGLVLGYFLISTGLLIRYGIWIDLFLPLCVIGFTYGGSTISKVFEEARKRELLEKELDIARTIQRNFLPQDLSEFNGIEISTFMQPARFVAGDLYDIIPLDENRLGVFIGDVSGKGISASLIMAQTVSLFRIFARSIPNPAEVLRELNKELCKILQARFVTALYLIVDLQSHLITASCAGHNPIISCKNGDKEISIVLPISGPPLGILESLEYEYFNRPINKGDKFLLYTDGISEAKNKKGEEFGIERLKSLFLRYKHLSGKQVLDELKKDVFKFCKGLTQHDDITLILLNINY